MDRALILKGLNEAQREAVRTTEGPLLIVAGPGSGKTRVLTCRIAWMLATKQTWPSQILALTFTNKAANEMKARILALVEAAQGPGVAEQKSLAPVWMGTFHSMFARLLRMEAENLSYTRDFSIYDTDDSERVVKELLREFNYDPKIFKPRAVAAVISWVKNQLWTVDQFEPKSRVQEAAKRILEGYDKALRAANALDFDDLLLKPLELFRQQPAILAKYQRKWTHLLIDEYQDTNSVQYELARNLAALHGNICAVGDDSQSIYRFRGAEIKNIFSFTNDFPHAQILRLEQNYRSSQNILRLADSVIRHNRQRIEKRLWTENEEGSKVAVLSAVSEKDEAQKAERIVRLQRVRNGYRYNDFAILYRTNAQSRSFEDALRREGVPYRVVGGLSFYQRKEIKDAVAYLRLLVNPDDTAAFRRVVNYPTRGIGLKSQQVFMDYVRVHNCGINGALACLQDIRISGRARNSLAGFRDMLKEHAERLQNGDAAGRIIASLFRQAKLLEDLQHDFTPKGQSRVENVQELISAIAEHATSEDGTLSSFIQSVALLTDAEEDDGRNDRVTLMTAHASKGLEFEVVFIGGLEEGLFPIMREDSNNDSLEEERRLFYVAATRAKRHLYLSWARTRFVAGRHFDSDRSMFLDEIDQGVLTEDRDLYQEYRRSNFSDQFGQSLRGARSMRTRETWRRTQLKRSGRLSSVTPARIEPLSSGESNPGPAQPAQDYPASGMFSVGSKVRHRTFGAGYVVALGGRGDMATATVKFDVAGTKKLILKYARLTLEE